MKEGLVRVLAEVALVAIATISAFSIHVDAKRVTSACQDVVYTCGDCCAACPIK